MRVTAYLLLFISLIGIRNSVAQTYHYHTTPAQPQSDARDVGIPLIEVDPDSGEKKVFLRPNSGSSSGTVEQKIVSASYQPGAQGTESGLHQAIAQLQEKMTKACPDGWIKLQEWGIPENSAVILHYSFACLN